MMHGGGVKVASRDNFSKEGCSKGVRGTGVVPGGAVDAKVMSKSEGLGDDPVEKN